MHVLIYIGLALALLALAGTWYLQRRGRSGERLSHAKLSIPVAVSVIGMWLAALGLLLGADTTFNTALAWVLLAVVLVVTGLIARLWLPIKRDSLHNTAGNEHRA